MHFFFLPPNRKNFQKMNFYLQLGFIVFLTPCLHCPWLSRNYYKQEIKKKIKNKQTNPKQKKNLHWLVSIVKYHQTCVDGVGLCAICQMPVIFLISKYILFR